MQENGDGGEKREKKRGRKGRKKRGRNTKKPEQAGEQSKRRRRLRDDARLKGDSPRKGCEKERERECVCVYPRLRGVKPPRRWDIIGRGISEGVSLSAVLRAVDHRGHLTAGQTLSLNGRDSRHESYVPGGAAGNFENEQDGNERAATLPAHPLNGLANYAKVEIGFDSADESGGNLFTCSERGTLVERERESNGGGREKGKKREKSSYFRA